MFLQIGRRYTPFSALRQLFPTLPIIWAQVAAKRFFKIRDGFPLNLKMNAQRPNTRARHVHCYQYRPTLSFRWIIPSKKGFRTLQCSAMGEDHYDQNGHFI
jgi:hypothetical protein